MSEEKHDWIAQTALERLEEAPNGLGENVLVAGIQHRAKGQPFDFVAPGDVKKVLKSLRDSSRVKVSAGRWSAIGRRWS